MDFLISSDGGKAFNLVLAIQKPDVEMAEVTAVVDEIARAHGLKSTMDVRTHLET